jgi:hypothetical protein
MREYKYNEALYEILIKQFEAAKLDESKDAALLQIIERAEAPEVRVKPDRRKIVVRTGVLFLVFSILGVLVRSYYHSYISDPLNQTLIENLKTCLTFDQLKKDLNMDSVVNGFFKLFHRR